MNRRSLLSLFAYTPLILLPEPRKAYSFLWARETAHERVMREVTDAMRAHFVGPIGAPLIMPPGATVEWIGSKDELLREKRLTLRVRVQPLSWDHAMRLRAEGFEFA